MPPQLAVTIRGDGVQLSPGTTAAFSIEVRNLGSVVDRYRCELVGIDPSWYTVTPASMELFPQNEGGSTARPDAPPSIGRFQVTLHPPRSSEAKAGPWPFGAKVTSEHDPSNRRVEEGTVSFLPFGALEADIRPAVVSGRFGHERLAPPDQPRQPARDGGDHRPRTGRPHLVQHPARRA